MKREVFTSFLAKVYKRVRLSVALFLYSKRGGAPRSYSLLGTDSGLNILDAPYGRSKSRGAAESSGPAGESVAVFYISPPHLGLLAPLFRCD